MRFQPLRPERKNASYDEFKAFLRQLSPEDYREMAFHSLQRVHQDLQTGATTPPLSDARAWREYVLPALTTASPEDVYALVLDPADLKRRTIGLIQGVWDAGYAAEYAKHHEILEKAAEFACKTTSPGFGLAFPELTGNRLPAPLVSRLNDIEDVTFCPSYYLNNFVSYILYPPQLIVFFAAPEFINRSRAAISQNGHALRQVSETTIDLTDDQFLDALRARRFEPAQDSRSAFRPRALRTGNRRPAQHRPIGGVATSLLAGASRTRASPSPRRDEVLRDRQEAPGRCGSRFTVPGRKLSNVRDIDVVTPLCAYHETVL